jgi:hypothetical protein
MERKKMLDEDMPDFGALIEVQDELIEEIGNFLYLEEDVGGYIPLPEKTLKKTFTVTKLISMLHRFIIFNFMILKELRKIENRLSVIYSNSEILEELGKIENRLSVIEGLANLEDWPGGGQA